MPVSVSGSRCWRRTRGRSMTSLSLWSRNSNSQAPARTSRVTLGLTLPFLSLLYPSLLYLPYLILHFLTLLYLFISYFTFLTYLTLLYFTFLPYLTLPYFTILTYLTEVNLYCSDMHIRPLSPMWPTHKSSSSRFVPPQEIAKMAIPCPCLLWYPTLVSIPHFSELNHISLGYPLDQG